MPAVLPGNGLLTPLQRRFLALFAKLADQDQFYLTGGTALAEYYLGHRLSFDLDLFTAERELVLPMSFRVEQACQADGLQVSVTKRFASYVEFTVQTSDEAIKADFALDSPFRFGPPERAEHGVAVNNYADLRIDKLLAYYGRAEPRDAVDLYFIAERDAWNLLFEQAARKDPGFDLYWMAGALNRAAEFPEEVTRWPVQMLKPFDPRQLKAVFGERAQKIMDQLGSPPPETR